MIVMWQKAGVMRMVVKVPLGAKAVYHPHGAEVAGLLVGLSP